MARQERYTIGPNLLRDIRSTIQKVDALAPHTSGPTQGVRYWDMQRPPSQRTDVFRICTFTGAWATNSSKVVTFKYQETTPNTVSVTNLFWPVPDGPIRDCSIAKDGTAWFLIVPQLYLANAATAATITGSAIRFDTLPVVALATAGTATFSLEITTCPTGA